MPFSITCSNKILTLAIAPFLFILVDVLCEMAMVPGVYILLFPQEKEVPYSFWEHRCTDVHIQHHIHQKDLNLCLKSCDYDKVIDELKKNTNEEFSCVTWCLQWDQVTLSNLFLVSMNVLE